jgi:hypothetical protein
VDIHAITMEKRRDEEAPPHHLSNLVSVLSLGYALPVDNSINELRRFDGLDAVDLVPAESLKILLGGGPREG